MGKQKYIDTPERLWELFLEYKNEVKSNPRLKTEFVGKDGIMVKRPLERPLILSGFRGFARGKHMSVEHYFANTDKAYEDYRTICSRITDEIRTEQIDGGMTGVYNPSITQRLNNLVEKSAVKIEDVDVNFED